MSVDVSVVIVNFNAGQHLERCLASLVRHLGNAVRWDAVVVDNASTDASAEAVVALAPQVTLIRNTENVGFSRAVNQGARATRGPAVLLLNPDAQLGPDAAMSLLRVLDAAPACGAVGPAVINDDGTVQGSARGDPDMMTGLFGRTTLLSRLFPRSPAARRNVVVAADTTPHAPCLDVDWVSGACMLVRRRAFDAVGGFDERFFLYWEDADFCRRLRAAGFTVKYCPAARVGHAVGRSSQTVQRLAIRAFHRSAYLYYAIHVAPSPWDPARWMAWLMLQIRCQWQLRLARRPNESE